MPVPEAPLTPAPSTDILGKEHVDLGLAQLPFDLPPSALSHRSSSPSKKLPNDNQVAAVLESPTSSKFLGDRDEATGSHSRKKRTATQAGISTDHVTLPPPPTRPRKIIQVKPKSKEHATFMDDAAFVSSHATAMGNSETGNSKKKRASGPMAGRKIARKTAHSLIERRRRSKMNEEFGVLKDLVPACAGQEMHKLAILQASIEYLRYLQTCVSDMQASSRQSNSPGSSPYPTHEQSSIPTPSAEQSASATDSASEIVEDYEPTQTGCQSRAHAVHRTSGVSMHTSPASLAMPSSPLTPVSRDVAETMQAKSVYDLPSSVSTNISNDRSYGPYTAPAFIPSARSDSNQPSPMLLPQSSHSSAPSELDQEASAALLMLNASDRRSSISDPRQITLIGDTRERRWKPQQKAISVKDLLSN